MLQAGGPITITLSDRVQLSRCFARESSHAKVTLLPESRRDRYRTYELNKTNIAIILVILAVFPFVNLLPVRI
jgi:hypothetical protein